MDHTFESGWGLPDLEEDTMMSQGSEEQEGIIRQRYVEEVQAWFERESLSTGRFTLNGFTADLPDEPFLSIPIV